MIRTPRTLLLSVAAIATLATAATAAPTPPTVDGAFGDMASMHATPTTPLHTAGGGMAGMHAAMVANRAPWLLWLSMGAVWIIGIGVIVWAVTALFPDQPPGGPQRNLDRRLARGEAGLKYRRRCDEPHTNARAAKSIRA